MSLKQINVLIIDDDRDVLTAVRFLLNSEVKNIYTDSNPQNLRRLLSEHKIDILLLDMNYNSSVNTGNEGLFWMRQAKEQQPDLQVILITAYADIDLAVRSLKEGASDFIVKPWHNDNLLHTLREVGDKKPGGSRKRGISSEKSDKVDIIGNSEVMQTLFRKIEKVAPTDANILILGENGTGKDLIAKAIYQLSLRKDKPYIKVDMGSLTETLFESELFGHKKGAFTDAREDRKGLFEEGDTGTLFLDEIGNITLQQQAKLLTVLQNRQVTRLGTNVPIPVDIRLISATNAPLSQLADEDRFRKDLIYRINTVEIMVPPLRERGSDIILLSEYFLDVYTKKYMKPDLSLSDPARTKLMQYHFPGNVRELQYAVERAVIMADSSVLSANDIIFSPIEQKTTEPNNTLQTHNLEDLERTAITKVIEKHDGNISKAAKELGLTRAALYRRLSKYGM